jgi:tetrahydromethanopterin S-methyltransferase subunit G
MVENNELEKIVLTRLVRLNATIQGIGTGLVVGLGIFMATNWLVLKGGDVVGPHLSLLSQFFIGYTVSFIGSLIGFAYGFLSGFSVGYLIAMFYNWIVSARKAEAQA